VLPHEPGLRAWLTRRRISGLEIDDIVQETYARLAALDSVEGVRDPRNYAYQTAWSIVASHVRHARVVSIRARADVEELSVPADEVAADEALIRRDELTEIAEALASLPEPCRNTFILRRVEGLSQRETAERLGISEKTIEKHMARGIRLLMDRFGRGGNLRGPASKRGENRQEHEREIDEPAG
jgi:RNA polymerase sigma-70 factor (ECF subfamily)